MEARGLRISKNPTMTFKIPSARDHPQLLMVWRFEIAKNISMIPAITNDVLKNIDNVAKLCIGVAKTTEPIMIKNKPISKGMYQFLMDFWN